MIILFILCYAVCMFAVMYIIYSFVMWKWRREIERKRNEN